MYTCNEEEEEKDCTEKKAKAMRSQTVDAGPQKTPKFLLHREEGNVININHTQRGFGHGHKPAGRWRFAKKHININHTVAAPKIEPC
jgi:hypothetical protein